MFEKFKEWFFGFLSRVNWIDFAVLFTIFFVAKHVFLTLWSLVP